MYYPWLRMITVEAKTNWESPIIIYMYVVVQNEIQVKMFLN